MFLVAYSFTMHPLRRLAEEEITTDYISFILSLRLRKDTHTKLIRKEEKVLTQNH